MSSPWEVLGKHLGSHVFPSQTWVWTSGRRWVGADLASCSGAVVLSPSCAPGSLVTNSWVRREYSA